MNLLQFSLINILHRPMRNAVSVLTIALGVAAIVAMTAIAWGFEASWQQANDLRGTDLIVTRKLSESAMPAAFHAQAVRDALQSLPGIAEQVGLLSEMLDVAEDTPPVFVFGWEWPSFLWKHLSLVDGRWPRADAEDEVVIGSLLPELLHRRVGDSLRIEGQTVHIVGVFESRALVENGAVILSLRNMQRLMEKPDKINVMNLRLAPDWRERPDQVKAQIAQRLPGFMAIRSADLVQQNTLVKIMKAMSMATMAIAWTVGLLIIFNAMLMSVNERRQDIGILLAVGWRRSLILGLFMAEGMVISLAGSLLGCALGSGIAALLQQLDLTRGKLVPEFSPAFLLLVLLVSVLLGLLGGLLPALRATRIQPAAALRAE